MNQAAGQRHQQKARKETERKLREAEQAGSLFASVTAEQAVCASILLDRDVMGVVVDTVSVDDFADARCREVYEAMVRLWDRQVPPDFLTVTSELNNDPEMIGFCSSLLTMAGILPVHGEYYARIVARNAERRRFMQSYQTAITDMWDDPTIDLEDVLSRIGTEAILHKKKGIISFSRAAELTIERVSMEVAGAVERREVPTGYRELDAVLAGGWSQDIFAVLAARSSMGKTSLAVDFLMSAANVGGCVFFSAEMGQEQIMRRIASRAAGVKMEKIQMGTMSKGEYDRFMVAMEEIQGKPIFLDDSKWPTTDHMQLQVQRLQADHDIRFVLFDFLELAGNRMNEDRRVSDVQRMAEVGQRMKRMNEICGVPVLALSQVGRQVEERDDKVPQLADLRGSDTIGQLADVVITMYAHDHYVRRHMAEPDPDRAGVMELHVVKNRNGPVDTIMLGMEMETFRFWSLKHGR